MNRRTRMDVGMAHYEQAAKGGLWRPDCPAGEGERLPATSRPTSEFLRRRLPRIAPSAADAIGSACAAGVFVPHNGALLASRYSPLTVP
jgi:hypothetical protein